MNITAKILADSIGPAGVRLTTIEAMLPRSILAQLNTHRTLSRSSASSRAIPTARRLAAPIYVPERFGKNQAGMSPDVWLEGDDAKEARLAWETGAQSAQDTARDLSMLGVHKEHANRVLEPFMWNRAIITGTEWTNMLALRTHKGAQGEFQELAVAIRETLASGTPRVLHAGEWHTPFLDDDAELSLVYTPEERRYIATGRCARISYETHDGARDPAKDLELARKLAEHGHMAPLEHVAQALTLGQWEGLVMVELQEASREGRLFNPGAMGNLLGWRQLRKTIEHEGDFSKRGEQ